MPEVGSPAADFPGAVVFGRRNASGVLGLGAPLWEAARGRDRELSVIAPAMCLRLHAGAITAPFPAVAIAVDMRRVVPRRGSKRLFVPWIPNGLWWEACDMEFRCPSYIVNRTYRRLGQRTWAGVSQNPQRLT